MQKVYQSSAIDISLQEGAESDCANTEKVQQLLCPQDFSLQFYFFSESDSAKVLFCIKGHHNFFHKIAFFSERDISFANMSWDNENRQKFTSNTA